MHLPFRLWWAAAGMGPVRLLSGASLPCRIPSPGVWVVPGEPLTKQKMPKVTALGPLVLLPGGLGQGITGRKWGGSKGENVEHPPTLASTTGHSTCHVPSSHQDHPPQGLVPS